MHQFLIRKLIKYSAKKAAYQILNGRLIDRDAPEKGRFLPHHVDTFLNQTWRNVDQLLPEAHLEMIPTRGNRLNVFLAVITIAAYQAFVHAGIQRDYAIELFADIGWKVYAKLLALPKLISRLCFRNPQKRINFILRMFMLYPFSTPGVPGYECKAWPESNCYCTYWTHCPPYEFVNQYVNKHGDQGELAAFQKSWCWYDWALTYAMLDGGYQVRGYYQRPNTLSMGGEICDMKWHAEIPPTGVKN